MASLFSNLSISLANNAYDVVANYAAGKLNQLVDRVANGKQTVKFYYRPGNRTFLRTLVNSSLQIVGNQAKVALLNLAKQSLSKMQQETYAQAVQSKRQTRLIEKGRTQIYGDQTSVTDSNGKSYTTGGTEYGKMDVIDNAGRTHSVLCRDYMGFQCSDGLMLKIPTKKNVQYLRNTEVIHPINLQQSAGNLANGVYSLASDDGSSSITETFEAPYLIWSDATAMITFSSSKNTIITPVAGRDYSRKELASNGDIKFSVSGHILSTMAEILPDDEIKKFIEVMQYKGLVEVNNILLDQFNIEKILILDFNLTPIEGSKARIDYSFNAIGIQPPAEVEVDEDTLFIDTVISNSDNGSQNAFVEYIKSKAVGTSTLTDNAITTLVDGLVGKLSIK